MLSKQQKKVKATIYTSALTPANFDTSVACKTTNILNAYKSRKHRATLKPGDYFIDLAKLRQGRKKRHPCNSTIAIVVDGKTAFWYLPMLKRNERKNRVNIKPEIPGRKT